MLTDMNKESGDVASRMGLHNKEGTGVSHPLVYGIVAGATLSMTLLGLGTSVTGAHRRLREHVNPDGSTGVIESHGVTVASYSDNDGQFMSLENGELGINERELLDMFDEGGRIGSEVEPVEVNGVWSFQNDFFDEVSREFKSNPVAFEAGGDYEVLNDAIAYAATGSHDVPITHPDVEWVEVVHPLIRLMNIKNHKSNESLLPLTKQELQDELIPIARKLKQDNEWGTQVEVPKEYMQDFADIEEAALQSETQEKLGWGFYEAPDEEPKALEEAPKALEEATEAAPELPEAPKAEEQGMDPAIIGIIVCVTIIVLATAVIVYFCCCYKKDTPKP